MCGGWTMAHSPLELLLPVDQPSWVLAVVMPIWLVISVGTDIDCVLLLRCRRTSAHDWRCLASSVWL
jgi:hypothetical protein